MFEKKPDHTVYIDNFGFYAESPTPNNAFRDVNWEEVKIDRGPSKHFPTNEELRNFTFQSTIEGDIIVVRNALERLLKKICDFSSEYIGAFHCYVKIKITYQNAFVGVTFAEFTIQEVEDG
jgi:hypothetical protein